MIFDVYYYMRYGLSKISFLLILVTLLGTALVVSAQTRLDQIRTQPEFGYQQNQQDQQNQQNQQNRYHPDPSVLKVARLHYSGGGDWYWGSSAIPNFLKFVRDNSDFPVDTLERQVRITDPELFQYPFLFATGHGVISFSAEEQERLRQYLMAGGFLFVNDSYGMDETFRGEMAALFPEREVVELPFDHKIYHSFYDFPNGPPKIHEHDDLPPRGYAIMVNGRVVLYFLVESDIGDGWEDEQVHNDPPEKRDAAFGMGLNILTYALLY